MFIKKLGCKDSDNVIPWDLREDFFVLYHSSSNLLYFYEILYLKKKIIRINNGSGSSTLTFYSVCMIHHNSFLNSFNKSNIKNNIFDIKVTFFSIFIGENILPSSSNIYSSDEFLGFKELYSNYLNNNLVFFSNKIKNHIVFLEKNTSHITFLKHVFHDYI